MLTCDKCLSPFDRNHNGYFKVTVERGLTEYEYELCDNCADKLFKWMPEFDDDEPEWMKNNKGNSLATNNLMP